MKYIISILIIITFISSSNSNEINFKINKPYEVFISKEKLSENLNFYRDNFSSFSFCLKNSDDADNDLISIKNLNKKNHIKKVFNKTFTDWDVMDEHADAMNDFALIVCKVMINVNRDDKIELLNFIIELSKLENFYSISPEWIEDHSGPYWYARNLPPFLFAWSFVRDLANNDQQEYMHEWIKKLYDNLNNDDGCKLMMNNSCFGNHTYNVTNSLITMSILLNDNKRFEHSVNRFFTVLNKNITKDGLFLFELKRQHCSSHYHIHSLNPIFAILQNLKTQGYDYFNTEISGNFKISEIIDSIFNKFLIYPKKYLENINGFYATKTCPTKGQEFKYKFEQADFLQTAQFGFVSIYKNNISNQNIEFNKIKKLKVYWSTENKNKINNIFEDYNNDGLIDTLEINEIDASYNIYGNTWGDAVFGGFPFIFYKNEDLDQYQ